MSVNNEFSAVDLIGLVLSSFGFEQLWAFSKPPTRDRILNVGFAKLPAAQS